MNAGSVQPFSIKIRRSPFMSARFVPGRGARWTSARRAATVRRGPAPTRGGGEARRASPAGVGEDEARGGGAVEPIEDARPEHGLGGRDVVSDEEERIG